MSIAERVREQILAEGPTEKIQEWSQGMIEAYICDRLQDMPAYELLDRISDAMSELCP